MTSTVSFKEKFKQAFSFFKWDLKSCSGTLAVFGILASVATTIILTLCLVAGFNESSLFYSLSLVYEDSISQFDMSIKIFQYASAGIIYLMTTFFTIFYTVKIFSYLHNKRKADLYGSLPVGRITLYFTKAASAFIFSVVPTLFFLGIISIISICFGQPIVNEVNQMYLKIIMGAFASISAYGLVSVCCGTTLNSVIMFIAVCIAYPLSAMFIKGTISGFFFGFYSGVFREHFIMNALNPLAAYDGINIIYWIIFSLTCLASAAFLVKKRKTERAQSSFAYYLPCHLVKVLVAFLSGMFLGVLFGSLNVLSDGFLGFIFGFLLGSIPAFIICHLIFYKGFSRLIKTSVPLGCLIIAVITCMALCNYDVFGYNEFIPNADNIKSAGLYISNYTYINSDENFKETIHSMADDFSDDKSKNDIIELHKELVNNQYSNSSDKFESVWYNMLSDNFSIGDHPLYGVSYRMNNSTVTTRVYTTNILEESSIFSGYFSQPVHDCFEIISKKKYIEKYSGMTHANNDDITSFSVCGRRKNTLSVYSDVISQYDDNTDRSDYDKCEKIRKAFIKDFKENEKDYEKVMYHLLHEFGEQDYYYYDYYDYYDNSEVFDEAKELYPDIVCAIDLCADNTYNSDYIPTIFSSASNGIYSEVFERYMIPKSFTNTLKALQEADILNSNLTLK